eukprot:6004012-Prymnesium_polylepis.1
MCIRDSSNVWVLGCGAPWLSDSTAEALCVCERVSMLYELRVALRFVIVSCVTCRASASSGCCPCVGHHAMQMHCAALYRLTHPGYGIALI